MSYPVGWDLVNITGTYVGRNGVPCVGSVTLSSPQLVLRTGTIVPAADIVFELVNGVFSGQIPATDDPNAQPSGWTYTVTENVPGGRQGYQIVAPHTSPGIDLSTVIPVTLPMPPTFGFPYITLSQLAGTTVGNGAYLVGYKNPGSGAVARTVQSRLQDTVSVRDFGAVGDSATDDTAAVMAAMAALPNGGIVLFPASSGRYVLNGVTVDQPNITWRGVRSPFGGLLTKQPVWVRQAGFGAFDLDATLGSTFTTTTASVGFGVFNATGVTMTSFTFHNCVFNGYFFSVFFFGNHDELPAPFTAHTLNPIFDTSITLCQSTAPVGVNAGHFQHCFTRGSVCSFNRTYNGQNASSYNFVHDCRDMRVVGNIDYSSAWGGCEIENSPLANGWVSGNQFISTAAGKIADVWFHDSAFCVAEGNWCAGPIYVTCANEVAGQFWPADETCVQTQATVSNNSAALLNCSQYSTYVSGNILANLSGNTLTGSGTTAIFGDGQYVMGSVQHNRVLGTFTYGFDLTRTASTNMRVHDNVLAFGPLITGSGGSLVTYNNDVAFASDSSNVIESNLTTGGLFFPTPPGSQTIMGNTSANYVFTLRQTVTQFSASLYGIRVVSRNSNNGDVDAIVYNVLVSNQSGTVTFLATPFSKVSSNTASNVSITYAMSGTTLTVTVNNLNAAPNTLQLTLTIIANLRL